MSFLRKVMDHLLNKVLVETLANNRSFQRFAVWSHRKVKDLGEKSKDGGANFDESASKALEQSKLAWQKWRQEFAEELAKAQRGESGGARGK
mmetsp:Transcript_23723/g.65228  ORF Transcript_23723/g.65228 Transcript_23723/m.65228 type:complete len:92 (+) Transcript_23723:201-476(+)